jgi:hypothetical protein
MRISDVNFIRPFSVRLFTSDNIFCDALFVTERDFSRRAICYAEKPPRSVCVAWSMAKPDDSSWQV